MPDNFTEDVLKRYYNRFFIYERNKPLYKFSENRTKIYFESFNKKYLVCEKAIYNNLDANVADFFKEIYMFIDLNRKFNTYSVFYKMPKFIFYKILDILN